MKEGWKMVKLEDVCNIKGGSTPLKSNKLFWENGTIPWFTVDDIREQGRVINYTSKHITELASQKLCIYPIDTILLCCTASVGEYAITKIETTSNQQFNGLMIKDKSTLLPEYLFHFSSTLKDKLLKLSGKTTIDFVSVSKLSEILLPLPPLEEQHRIVSILDVAFEKIDALKANAEENLKNAKALFQQVLAQELKPKEGWVEKKLGEVAKEIFAGGDAPKNNMSKMSTEKYKIPIYANAVEDDGLYGFTDYARVNEPAITIVARGSGTGYVLRRNIPFLPIVRLIVVLPKDIVDINYIYYALKNMTIRKTGSAIPQLTVPMIREYKINYPNIKEQHRIVQTLDALSEKCRRLETIAQQTIRECDALKQSILRQAFSGKL